MFLFGRSNSEVLAANEVLEEKVKPVKVHGLCSYMIVLLQNFSIIAHQSLLCSTESVTFSSLAEGEYEACISVRHGNFSLQNTNIWYDEELKALSRKKRYTAPRLIPVLDLDLRPTNEVSMREFRNKKQNSPKGFGPTDMKSNSVLSSHFDACSPMVLVGNEHVTTPITIMSSSWVILLFVIPAVAVLVLFYIVYRRNKGLCRVKWKLCGFLPHRGRGRKSVKYFLYQEGNEEHSSCVSLELVHDTNTNAS